MSVHVMAWVFEHSEAELGARLVLLVLADHAKNDGTFAWPSVETMAHEARLSRRAVQYALRRLEDDGAIVKSGVTRTGCTIYTVKMGAQNLRGGAIHDTVGAQSTTSGGATASPEPSKEPSKEPSRKKLSSPTAAEQVAVDEVFEHWRSMMDTPRSMLTEERKKAVLARLRDNYSVERLKRAVDGCHGSDWNMGRDPKTAGKLHNDLELICRTGGQVERFEKLPTVAARPVGKYDHLGSAV